MADENVGNDGDTADEWAAMLSGDTEGDGNGANARVLNQNEIDALLGFGAAVRADEANTGLAALLGKSRIAYEKLPMLEIIFDRMVRLLSTSLRNFTSDNVDVSIDSMVSMRFDDYLNSIPLPALMVVFRANEWENFGIVMVDSALIYSMVDVLLGGRRTNKTVRVEGRPYTTIEQDIVKSLVEIVLSDMGQSFDPISPVTFQYERLESNPRFATITRPNNSVLLVRLRVEIDERSGLIEVMIPHETLEPIRDLLSQIFIGEKFGQDSSWEKHMSTEIRNSNVLISALLDEKHISLGDLVNLQIGSTILLDKAPNDDIQLKCGDVMIGKARLGRVGEKIAVSLLEPIKAKAERN
jgi:flagellar motor switch protein FliM